MAKGKDHKQYGYGNKVSIASTAKSNLIVGVASHERGAQKRRFVVEHIDRTKGIAII